MSEYDKPHVAGWFKWSAPPTFSLFTHFPPSEDEPIATTPTHEADQGHMSGAEEAPPTSNVTPAVVPSPDDSAKEVTEQAISEGDVEEGGSDQDESKYIDVEGDGGSEGGGGGGGSERLDSVSIDPSYNPSGEELLYEGDMEVEQPLPKSTEKEGATSQDEGFMISVHETVMELDIAVSDSDSKDSKSKKKPKSAAEKESGAKRSPLRRGGQESSKEKSSGSSKSGDGKSSSRASSSKDVDRLVL